MLARAATAALALGAATLATAQSTPDCPSIAEVATGVPELSTLLELAQRAGLVEALSDAQAELTLFAPTNDALAALDADTVAALESPENLAAVLKLHVVPAAAFAADLSDGQQLDTLAGESLTVSLADGGVTIVAPASEAAVVTADVAACKSVVHVIDGVLLPAALPDAPVDTADGGAYGGVEGAGGAYGAESDDEDVDTDTAAIDETEDDDVAEDDDAACTTALEVAAATPDLSTLAALAQAAAPELVASLSDPAAALTIFAPNNGAFEALGDALDGVEGDALEQILKLHVVPAAAFAADLSDGQELETLAGAKLVVGVAADGTVTVTAPEDGSVATVVTADVEACETVVHIIDAVLVPGEGQ